MTQGKINKRYISFMLVFTMIMSILLTGCQNQDSASDGSGMETAGQSETHVDDTENSGESSLQKGRYAEEAISFPNEIRELFDVKKKDANTVQAAAETAPGSLYLYESTDKGKTWSSKIEIAEGNLPGGYRAVDAVIQDDGSMIVAAGEMSAEEWAQQQPVGKFAYYIFPADGGEPEALSLELPEADEENLLRGFGLRRLQSTDGFLYGLLGIGGLEAAEDYLYCMDLSDGSKKWSQKINRSDYALYGSSIYLDEAAEEESDTGKRIKTLDARTGEEKGTAMLPTDTYFFNRIDMDLSNNKMFYGTEEGIFSCDSEIALTEKLVDGRYCSLNAAGYNISNLYMLSENVFLVFMRPNDHSAMKALRYEYDPNLPIRPEKLVRVYSLKPNRTIYKMVYDFKEKNPDIAVNYEIGMDKQSITSVTDAINILNTEILAGNGPDVIVLNGLPWQSYSEKGILMDLSEELTFMTEKESFFENLFSVYQTEDGRYAAPVSFKIPVVLSSKETAQTIRSLESFVEATEQTGDTVPHYRKDQNLIRYITSVYWNSVQQEDSISRENLKNMLEQIKRMNDYLKQYENGIIVEDSGADDRTDVFGIDTYLEGYSIYSNNQKMDVGYLSTIAACIQNYVYNVGAGFVTENVFSPLLVGINEKATEAESAKKFLQFILSAEEQEIFSANAYPQMDNLPVNRDAFINMTQNVSEEEKAEQGKQFETSGIEFRWPDQAYFDQLESMISGLSVPAMEDTVVIDTVLNSAWPYLNGEKDIETAVNEIAQKLELYFAE